MATDSRYMEKAHVVSARKCELRPGGRDGGREEGCWMPGERRGERKRGGGEEGGGQGEIKGRGGRDKGEGRERER